MRENLFRAKRKDNGEWVEGGLCIINKSPFICYEMVKGLPKLTEVEENTIGQYTGLTDKNGTKIFEGDVLKNVMRWCDEERNGVVTFKDGAFGFIWYRGEVEMFHAFVSVVNIEYEVIGNINDNPELLGDKQWNAQNICNYAN